MIESMDNSFLQVLKLVFIPIKRALNMIFLLDLWFSIAQDYSSFPIYNKCVIFFILIFEIGLLIHT
jgi:hypothetical protein